MEAIAALILLVVGLIMERDRRVSMQSIRARIRHNR